MAWAQPTLLGTYNSTVDDTSHTVTFDTPSTPGKSIVAVITSHGVVNSITNWAKTQNHLANSENSVHVLLAANHTVPLNSLNFTVAVPADATAIVFEDDIYDGSITINNASADDAGQLWGTSTHDLVGRTTVGILFGDNPTGTTDLTVSSWNRGTALAESGASSGSLGTTAMYAVSGEGYNGYLATMSGNMASLETKRGYLIQYYLNTWDSEHSIIRPGEAFSGVWNSATDGTPNIEFGNVFYRYGAAPGWWAGSQVVGARVYVDPSLTLPAGDFTIRAYSNSGTLTPGAHPSSFGTLSATYTANVNTLTNGWNTVYFSTPYAMPDGHVPITISFSGDPGYYIYGQSVTTETDGSINAWNATKLKISQQDTANGYWSSVYKIDTAYYGAGGQFKYPIDIVMSADVTATLSSSPPSLLFTASEGSGEPETDTLTVSASDASGVTISHSNTEPWLTVTPSQDTEPATFTVSADPTGLTAGTYNDTVTFSGSGYNDITVGVSFTITTPATFPVTIENQLPGNTDHGSATVGNGTVGYLGFAKQFSVNAGNTIDFAVDGVNAATIDIYRIGHYGGLNWRKHTTLTNTPTAQSGGTTIANSNGASTMSAWSTTASWSVPANTTSGLFVGVVKDSGGTPYSWIPFVVRQDSLSADIVIKVSDSTWGAAYNYFGDQGSEKTGKNLYGSGGPLGDSTLRSLAVSYDRPIVSRGPAAGDNVINHWDVHELALIDWVEQNGYNVKYISSYDLDQQAVNDVLGSANALVSVGHDEYWSQNMWDNAVAFRDAGNHLIFMSGNEVFWRVRYTDNGRVMWCYKDTLAGPDAHQAGAPLDPVSWTGTWRDTRRPGGPIAENNLTGTFFRMNRAVEKNAVISAATYQTHPFWRNTSVAAGTDLTLTSIIGFEADDHLLPNAGGVLLGDTTINIDGSYADINGETYSLNGNLSWGISCFYGSPTAGLTIGFATCSWMWALSNAHRRGPSVRSIAARQAMHNLLYDMGCTSETIDTDVTTPTPVALSTYGATYVPKDDTPVSAFYPDTITNAQFGTDTNPYSLTTRFRAEVDASITRIYYWKESASGSPTSVYMINETDGTMSDAVTVNWDTQTGWVYADLPTPYNIVTGKIYAAAVVVPSSFDYTYEVNGWVRPISDGPITAFASSFLLSGAPSPTGYTDAPNNTFYGVDVVTGSTFTPASLYIGSSSVDALYLGNTQVDKVYSGSTLVWEAAPSVPTTYTLFPGPTPQIARDTDTASVSLSTEFYVISAASVTKLRALRPTDPYAWTQSIELALYEHGNGTPVYQSGVIDVGSEVAGVWYEHTLPAPYALTPNQRYYCTTWWDGGGYSSVGGYFGAGGTGQDTLVQGPLVRPNNADSIEGQGRYAYGGSITYPAGTFNSGCYFSDVEVTT